MSTSYRVVALVPARGGSKGLPGKNIRPLLGKPLIGWAIETAKAAELIDDVVVSSDSDEILNVAQQFGATPLRRPDLLAQDDTIVADVVRHVAEALTENGKPPLYFVLLEATSPMRTSAMVDHCIRRMIEQDADSIATFSEAEPPPTRLWRVADDGTVTTFVDGADPWLPRQKQQTAYHLNGLAYGFHVARFLASGGSALFFGKKLAVITDGTVIDIDTRADFDMAEFLLSKTT